MEESSSRIRVATRGFCLQCKKFDSRAELLSVGRMAGWLRDSVTFRDSERATAGSNKRFNEWIDRVSVVREIPRDMCSHYHVNFLAFVRV